MSINTLPYNPSILQSPTVGGYSLLDSQVLQVASGSINVFDHTFTINGVVPNKEVLVIVNFQIPQGIDANDLTNYQLNVNGSAVYNQTLYCFTGVNNLNITFVCKFTPSTSVNQFQPYYLSSGTYWNTTTYPAYTNITVFQ